MLTLETLDADKGFVRSKIVPLGWPRATSSFRSRIHSSDHRHSIPDPRRSRSERRLGVIVHTGDWKLDPEPQLGENHQ